MAHGEEVTDRGYPGGEEPGPAGAASRRPYGGRPSYVEASAGRRAVDPTEQGQILYFYTDLFNGRLGSKCQCWVILPVTEPCMKFKFRFPACFEAFARLHGQECLCYRAK